MEHYLNALQQVTLSAEEIYPDDCPEAAVSSAESDHPLSEEQYFSTPHDEGTTPGSNAAVHTAASPLPGLASPITSGVRCFRCLLMCILLPYDMALMV